ncbi:MAG TPA: hypothetical protein VGI12_14750 [Vicinamibacterales bacterium]|jgi:uncharacterized membrane protein
MPIEATVVGAQEDKAAAIISYLTLLGFVVALVLNNSKKTPLGAYHLRQTLGLWLTAMACGVGQIVLVFIPILGWLAIFAMWGTLFVCWLMGLLAAIKGQMTPMPLVGGFYQDKLGTTFD